MTATETSQVWRVVWRAMGEWEADDGTGSARPVFVVAWAEATRFVSEPPTPHDLETAWRTWLQAGAPLTPERAAALLAEARTRGHAGELFAGTTLRRLRREPGQEG
jgi:hypothetical protein